MNTPTTRELDRWIAAGRRALLSGSLASVFSTAALALLGKMETGKAAAPTNATSHWLWGNDAYHAYEPSLRHTATGYITHHASAVFWAVLFERALDQTAHHRGGQIVRDAAVMTGVAAFVDYVLTPPRLRPGFEQHLSPGSLLAVFAALGAGLATGAFMSRRHERSLERIVSLSKPVRTPADPLGSRRAQPARISTPRGVLHETISAPLATSSSRNTERWQRDSSSQ